MVYDGIDIAASYWPKDIISSYQKASLKFVNNDRMVHDGIGIGC
jgi:hypothetical protein